MTMPTQPTQSLKIFRETSLPGTLEPYAIYMIAPSGAGNSAYVEMYVTSATGEARRIVNRDDIQLMISSALSAANNLTIVANISARNALSPTNTMYVFVTDATADNTVKAGGATYLYNTVTSTWIKISEAESLDVVVTWDSINGRPTSSVADIDEAVSIRHSHSNKTQLDNIDENNNGLLTYNGVLPLTGWQSTTW